MYILICIVIMILITNLIRILPVVLIRGRIRNPFVRSFLYYIPYVTLSVMTFPAIIEATEQAWIGATALLFGIIAAWRGWGLFPVAILCCAIVFALQWL